MRKFAVATVGVLVLLACTRTRAPRFGSLRADKRPFDFQHGIELLEAGNGLRIALLPDARTNLVTVDVRYEVGAAEDPKGRAGMAHLVEHLLFLLRTEPGDATLFDRFGEVSLSFNAMTSHDSTHYTTVALGDDLEAILELEARRMEFACNQLDEKLFLRERDVVLEEEAYRAGPYDKTRDEITAALWGADHPYARGIGTREIADASRDEVCTFVAEHYGPDRAILVVTGDFDVASISALIGKRFGPITRRSTEPRVTIGAPKFDGSVTEHAADVEEASALVFFPSPPWGGDEFPTWDIVTDYLGYELGEADEAQGWITSASIARAGGARALATVVEISVDDPKRLDEAVELVYAKAEALGKRTDWPAIDDFRGTKLATYMGSWDEFYSRPGWLADFLQYTDHNWFFLSEMAAFEKLTGAQLQGWSAANLVRSRSRVARVVPSGKAARDERVTIATAKEHDIALWRTPVDPDEANRPVTSGTERVKNKIVEEVLDNGLRVLLAPDPESPIAVARMIFPVGSAADPPDRRGVATVAGLMLGHENRQYPLAQANVLSWLLGLGASMDVDVAERVTTFEVRGLAMHADWHVWRLFWLLDLGHYDGKQLSRLQKNFEDDDDPDVRGHALRDALFGAAHPYSAPRMTAADLKKIGTGDLAAFRARHYKARGATLIVTGGFDVDAMRAEVIEFFGAWGGETPPPEVTVPAIMPADGPTWIGVREDTGSQPHLTIAFATTSSPNQDRAARLILIEMVEDRARVVRESLGATYGVSVQYSAGAGGAKLQLDAALDPAKAGTAMRALLDEIATLRDRTGELPEDFVRARRRALADALGDSAGALDLAWELTAVVHNGLPLDYFAKLAGEIGGTTLDDVAALAARDLAEQRMVVVLSGRGPVIDTAFEAAGITPKMLDGD